ncbi:DoxX family protein [Halioxenophilus sp. WMMB6]|uniref:DoxX family protein n=1 Tax=Halioxenophilus sp. WMMB6 TaxID=3073815 RepID=UPI00295E9D32|nr:DoxX family protein [Halioxenophilus sp. WMMB6]
MSSSAIATQNSVTTQNSIATPQISSAWLPAAADLAGRIGLAVIFALAAINKIQYFDANAAYMASGGVPAALLPLVIAFELFGALFVAAGLLTRTTAFALAGFSLVTAAMFHNNLADQIQFLMFFKNVAIAGGFLVVAAHGAGRFSIDSWRATKARR